MVGRVVLQNIVLDDVFYLDDVLKKLAGFLTKFDDFLSIFDQFRLIEKNRLLNLIQISKLQTLGERPTAQQIFQFYRATMV